MSIIVKCQTEDCGATITAPSEAQVGMDKLDGVLHKKNYYLCSKCGKVGAYTKEDHMEA